MWAALSLVSALMFWNPIMWIVDVLVTPGRILSAAFSTVTPSLEMGEPTQWLDFGQYEATAAGN